VDPTAPNPCGRGDRLLLAGLTGVLLAMTVLVYSPVDVPLVDDWTYAWSVEHFLHTEELRVLEWSAHYPLAQILWGAVFSRLLGFSFATLRLSTVVLAWAGLVAFFLTLRELGIKPVLAGLGTLLLWCNPVVFVLSHSFMTDVPFVSTMNAAILFYVRWVKRGRTWNLCLGSVSATLAFLIRQPGAVLALIPLLSLLLEGMAGKKRRALSWSQVIWLIVPFLGVGLTFWWIHAVHGATRVALEKAQMLRLIFSIDRWVWVYTRELLHALLHLGLVLWPLVWVALGRLPARALAGASAAVAVLSGLALWQEGALPNPLGIMLTWDELGHSRVLLAGEIAHRQPPRWGQTVVLGVALSGAVGLIAVLWESLRWRPRGGRAPATLLLLNLFLQSLLFEALWLYYDRYYLPLLPGCTALLLLCLRPTKIVLMVGTAGVLLWGAIAVTGTVDQWRYQRTVVEARNWLLQQGVGAEHIDAGYALTGWWLYAHAPSGPPSRGREPDVPWVTGWRPLPYKIADAATPAYAVVRRFRRPMLWAASDTLYVLEHTAVTDHWGLPALRARQSDIP
jgi:4-amino-4-deoxy-L-arabinose transferase-like glycosyltransferase